MNIWHRHALKFRVNPSNFLWSSDFSTTTIMALTFVAESELSQQLVNGFVRTPLQESVVFVNFSPLVQSTISLLSKYFPNEPQHWVYSVFHATSKQNLSCRTMPTSTTVHGLLPHVFLIFQMFAPQPYIISLWRLNSGLTFRLTQLSHKQPTKHTRGWFCAASRNWSC